MTLLKYALVAVVAGDASLIECAALLAACVTDAGRESHHVRGKIGP